MKTLFYCIICVSFFTSFRFGEPVAELKCKSISGRTMFEAVLPNLTYHERSHFEVDGVKVDFGIHDRGAVVFDEASKVLTIHLESEDGSKFLKFWAIPSTFKQVSGEKRGGTSFKDVYSFKGKIIAKEPRQGKANLTPEIELDCVLEYEL
jgi:hypothetical protein